MRLPSSTSDRIALAGTMISALGFCVLIVQLSLVLADVKIAAQNQRAQFLSNLHARAFEFKTMRDTLWKIELSDNPTFNETAEQEDVLRLLSFFELLGKLQEIGVVTCNDIASIFRYYIRLTHENPAVNRFLKSLELHDGITFEAFERIAQNIRSPGMIDDCE